MFTPRAVALVAGVMWLAYPMHGFRAIWRPLVESDTNTGSAVRQIVFTLCAALVVRGLLQTRRFAAAVQDNFGWFAFATGLVVTSCYSVRTGLTVTRAALFTMGLVTIVGLVRLSRDPVRFLLVAVTSAVGVVAWGSLGMWVVMPSNYWSLATRPGLAGITGHPNVLGPCLAIGWLLSLGIRSRSRGLLVSRVGILFALALTDSIASIAMALAGTLGFGLLVATRYARSSVCMLLLLGVSAIAIEPETVVSSALESVGRDSSLSGRDRLWAAVGKEITESPWVGVGYGAFWYEGRGREIMGTWNPRQSHNAYLDLLVEIGALGVVLFAMLVGAAWAAGWRTHWSLPRAERHATAALLAMTFALLGVGAFSESFLLKMDKFQFFTLMWVLLCMRRGVGGCR